MDNKFFYIKRILFEAKMDNILAISFSNSGKELALHFKYFNSVSDGTNLADGWASYMLISQTPIELLKKGDEIMGRIMPASKPQTFKQRIKFAGKTRQGSYNLKGNVNAGSERFVFTSEILEGKWSLTATKKKGLVTLKKLK